MNVYKNVHLVQLNVHINNHINVYFNVPFKVHMQVHMNIHINHHLDIHMNAKKLISAHLNVLILTLINAGEGGQG